MKKILSVLLAEFRENIFSTEDSVPREVNFSEVPNMINVVIGIRRSGKTYLIYQKIRELIAEGVSLDQVLFVNFEDDRLLPMDQKELGQLIDAFYSLYPENHERECYIFLDEIQNIEGWPLVVRRIFDSKKVKIYLTGSSAKLLSKEIATSLRGRSIATEVLPYSFLEYWKAQNIEKPTPPYGQKVLDQFHQHFQNYFSIGGFPAIQHLRENERLTILQGYVEMVALRDIVERHKLSNTRLIKYLIKTLIKNVAAPFSVNKFYKDIKSQGHKVGRGTIYQYLEYIEDSFLAFSVPIFSESIRKMEVNPKKIYVIDNGLVKANRLGISLQLGNLFENQIYLDLRRQGKKVRYYLTKDGYEIDFVIQNQDGSMELIQAVWDVSNKATLEREQRALAQAESELGIKGRIITPQDYILEHLNGK